MKASAVDGRVKNSRRDPELTKREILDAAAAEFALQGPRGARTDDIARRTNTSKRMIYYYFGSKEGLYEAVLRENYARIRSLEGNLGLDHLEPVEALRTLVSATLTHYERNPQMARIVALENLVQQGKVASRLDGFQELNQTAPDTVERILQRGREAGVMRSDPGAPSALDVHQVLSALTLNRIEHRATFKVAFGRDLLGPKDRAHVRALIEETVLRLVLADPAQLGLPAEDSAPAGPARAAG
ncbi:MAG: TetR/AcrR family transcriptional regulator [Propioniciclava sp.]|uniref:TetR/AcrR family transcriptional regulator n=1 Tax=Propioniciclava sp. TaxID=2038686 RepID=UPI0039E5C5C3